MYKNILVFPFMVPLIDKELFYNDKKKIKIKIQSLFERLIASLSNMTFENLVTLCCVNIAGPLLNTRCVGCSYRIGKRNIRRVMLLLVL